MAQQQGQQQQEARSRGQSPCHMKRRSFELPPTSKCRRSQVGATAHTASTAAAVCPRWLLHCVCILADADRTLCGVVSILCMR
jgi:hypothetical protein